MNRARLRARDRHERDARGQARAAARRARARRREPPLGSPRRAARRRSRSSPGAAREGPAARGHARSARSARASSTRSRTTSCRRSSCSRGRCSRIPTRRSRSAAASSRSSPTSSATSQLYVRAARRARRRVRRPSGDRPLLEQARSPDDAARVRVRDGPDVREREPRLRRRLRGRRARVRRHGDRRRARSASTPTRSRHVHFGWVWLKRFAGDGDPWQAYLAHVKFPLGPRRARGARFDREARRRAGFDEAFIDALAAIEPTRPERRSRESSDDHLREPRLRGALGRHHVAARPSLGGSAALAPLLAAFTPGRSSPSRIFAPGRGRSRRASKHRRTSTMRTGCPRDYDLAWAEPIGEGRQRSPARTLRLHERLAHAAARCSASMTSVDELDAARAATVGVQGAVDRRRSRPRARRRRRRVGDNAHLRDAPARAVRRARSFEPWCERAARRRRVRAPDADGRVARTRRTRCSPTRAVGSSASSSRRRRCPPPSAAQLERVVDARARRSPRAATRARSRSTRSSIATGRRRRFHPLCEINARHTFGHVAHALARRFGATRLGFGAPPPRRDDARRTADAHGVDRVIS